MVLIHGLTVMSTVNFATHYAYDGSGRPAAAAGPTVESALLDAGFQVVMYDLRGHGHPARWAWLTVEPLQRTAGTHGGDVRGLTTYGGRGTIGELDASRRAGMGRMLRDLIVHGRSIFARLDAEMNANAKYEQYPDSRRVPYAEGNVWLEGVREYFTKSSSDYLRARYNTEVAAYESRKDGTELEQARDYTWSLLRILEDAFALEAEPLKSASSESVSLDKTEVWDLFVSHASEDKESFVRPLVEVLSRHNLSVWFDSATLKLGDSLRAKIDQGLARSRYGLVVLSPAFFAKNWPMQELNGLVARETASGTKAILPIWHNIDQAGVARVSPLLADRLAVSSDRGLDAVCQVVIEALDI